MTSFQHMPLINRIGRFLIFIPVLALFCVLTPLSGATAQTATVNITNNSQGEIRHLYLAPAGTDDWGADQLGQPIAAGTSRNVNITWTDSTVKLIAEDEDGCFLTTTIEVAGSPGWTITDSTARDCGSGN